MKLFRCDTCGHAIYFENVVCQNCGHRLGYEPDGNRLLSLEGDGVVWHPVKSPETPYVFCANAEHGACNWLVPSDPGGDPFCRACRHNELVPALDDPHNLARWQTIERAKKRLVYSLLRFKLPLHTRNEDPEHGLSFRFLADGPAPAPVMTGHESGIITIALAEADDAEREYRRSQMNEPYRTLLGHFRHEIGHHYWDLLVARTDWLADFRQLFGDETADYMIALQRHYEQGAPDGWAENFVSAYATAHPWEDFAETWAHYLHLCDTVEMASAFGVRLDPVQRLADLAARIEFDPYRDSDVDRLMENWVPLASLMNNLNRAIGQPDAYPFVLSPPAVGKLGFVARLIAASRTG